jgi:gag-polypeptide of LTR copia-type/Zinc knuckle
MSSNERLQEGFSTHRPPLFDGKFYAYWKNRMEIFIKSSNYRCWLAIQDGDYKITKMDSESNVVEKPISEFTRTDYETVELNYQAMQMLMCGLGPNEHNRIMGCKSAKQIWNLLEVTHEGTNEVKRSKIDLLFRQYELFQMEPNESITQMITRFTNIVNELDSLGKSMDNEEQVRKILRVLPTSWMPKVTALKETKDFTKFTLEELIGSLMTHEIEVKSHEQNPRREKGLALQVEQSDEEEEDEEEEDIALLTRKFKKFYKTFKGNKNKGKFGSSSKNNNGCFECGSTDHIVKDCPKRKKQTFQKRFSNKNVRKAMMAAWGDSEDESEEEEEVNLCLMANETDSDSDEDDTEVNLETLIASIPLMSKNMLVDVLKDLFEDYMEVCNVNRKLKNDLQEKHDLLSKVETSSVEALGKLDQCMMAKTELEKQIQNLKAELNTAKQVARTSTNKVRTVRTDARTSTSIPRTSTNRPGTNATWLNLKDNYQRHGLGYVDVSYNKSRRPTHYKKKRGNLTSELLCYKCGSQGHIRYNCKSTMTFKRFDFANYMSYSTNRLYVKRQGPKQIWVPKNRN